MDLEQDSIRELPWRINGVTPQGVYCTLISVANEYENRVVDGGMDPIVMGRFGFVTMLGEGGAKLTIISLYRPCEGFPKGNEGTIWKQQWARAQVLKLGEKYDPRTNILLDIAKFVKK